MVKKIYSAQIEMTDFTQDPSNDAALRVNCEIRGRGDYYNMIYVYFSDRFIEEYFKIPWNKKLEEEEARIIKEHRSLFQKWTLCRVEEYLQAKKRGDRLMVEFPDDMAWAEQVEKGALTVKSKEIGPNLYEYKI